MSYYQKHVFVCTNTKESGKKCCAQGGGIEAFEYLKSALVEKGLHGPDKIRITRSGCLGRCAVGPCVVIYPEGVWYTYQENSDLDEIIEHHLILGDEVARLMLPSTER